jgi:hypothetical protein
MPGAVLVDFERVASLGIRAATHAAVRPPGLYLCDIPAANVAEYGRVLLPPGEEDAWFSSLPDAMRERLRPLA